MKNATTSVVLFGGQHNTVPAMTAFVKANAEAKAEVLGALVGSSKAKSVGFTGIHAQVARRMAQLGMKVAGGRVIANTLDRKAVDTREFWIA